MMRIKSIRNSSLPKRVCSLKMTSNLALSPLRRQASTMMMRRKSSRRKRVANMPLGTMKTRSPSRRRKEANGASMRTM